MEALLLNSSAVYLKWKPPALQAHNGKSCFSLTSQKIAKFDYFDLTWHFILIANA